MDKENGNDAEEANISAIKDALLALMAKQSYESIRIHHIAEAAGISRNTFYRCFKNKDEVIYEIYDGVSSNFMELIQQEIDVKSALNPPPADRARTKEESEEFTYRIVHAIVVHVFEGMAANREQNRLLFSPGVETISYNRFSHFFRRLCGAIIRRANLNIKEDKSIEFLLSHMTGSAFHFFKDWVLDDDAPSVEAISALYARVLTPSLILVAELSQ